MKKILLLLLKPLSFLPAILMICIIFGFSAQTGDASGNLSYEVSRKIIEIGNELLNRGLEDWQIDRFAYEIEYPVRKLAHMTEYFLLAVAVSFPLYVYGLRGIPLMFTTGLVCVALACGDEYHQSFVADRSPSVTDVLIDSVGAFFGILTIRIISWICLTSARAVRRQEI